MKKYFKDYAVLLILAGSIVLLDQWTKGLVRANLDYGEILAPDFWLSNYARIVHWRNTGAAFGIFPQLSLLFTILPVIVSFAILYYYPRIAHEDWLLRLALGLQLGGALGNLVDRIFYGHVTDFVSVGNFAVFNVADASISSGVAVLLLDIWIRERQEKKQAQQEESQETPAVEEGQTYDSSQ